MCKRGRAWSSHLEDFKWEDKKIVIPSLSPSCPPFPKASRNFHQSRIYISTNYILSDSYESPTTGRCISMEYKPLLLNMQRLKNKKAPKQATTLFSHRLNKSKIQTILCFQITCLNTYKEMIFFSKGMPFLHSDFSEEYCTGYFF